MTALWVLLLLATQEEKDRPSPSSGGVNEVKVAQAIDKGIAWLRTAPSPDFKGVYQNSDELFLLTFIHAGVPPADPRFQELFKSVTTAPLKRTYKVALLAMCLEELDRVAYQEKLAQCAQFLVDNQCANGQWTYGQQLETLKDAPVPEPGPRKEVASGTGKPKAGKSKPPKKIQIKKTQDGGDAGDNSNSLYAALGLRACHDANIEIPEAVLTSAVKWWRESQFNELLRNAPKPGRPAVASGPPVKLPAQGWNYKTPSTDERAPYLGMSAGAMGSLVCCLYMQKKDWKKDATVQAAYDWMTEKFEIQTWNGYAMYALERAGVLYGTETFGTRHWYREGANALLGTQRADGSWGEDTQTESGGTWYGKSWDTCFSILFLRRATRPLVASGVTK
jgi:hypothetical protein